MQNHDSFQPIRDVTPLADQVGNGYMHFPFSSTVPAIMPTASTNWAPIHGIEFQPSDVCPKNFIIFDQTEQRSQVMYHPAIAHKFSDPYLNMNSAHLQQNFRRRDGNDLERQISFVKEDSEDIDALLSLEEEEQDDYDDDEEISTARTYGNHGSDSSDSCSSYCSKPRKSKLSYAHQKSSTGATCCNTERKRQKMKKMVKVLKGIVPGGDHMDTVSVLDEAVKYLKSLKVDVQKLGVRDFNN